MTSPQKGSFGRGDFFISVKLSLVNYHNLPRTHLVSGSNHHPGIFEIPWQEMHLLVHETAKLSGKSTMKVDVFYSRQEVMFIVMLVDFSIFQSYISSKTTSIIWVFDSGNSACQLTLGLREMIQFQKKRSLWTWWPWLSNMHHSPNCLQRTAWLRIWPMRCILCLRAVDYRTPWDRKVVSDMGEDTVALAKMMWWEQKHHVFFLDIAGQRSSS